MSEPSKGYAGVLQGGKRNGSGVQTYPDGSSFAGVWANDRKRDGKYTLKNGDSFTGTWRDHKMHGTVRYAFGCGDSLHGEYAFGKPYGQVTVFLKKSGVTRVFPWSNLNAASVHSCARTARDLAMAFTCMVIVSFARSIPRFPHVRSADESAQAGANNAKEAKPPEGSEILHSILNFHNDST